MQTHAATGLLGVFAILGTLVLLPTGPADPPATQGAVAIPTSPVGSPVLPGGHLTMIVEGDARSMAITFIATKNDPYNRVRVRSPYEIVVLDGNNKELGRFPLDLSKFDLNPRNIGKPDQVAGDEVVSRKVHALTNIPWFTDAARLDIQKNKVSVGKLSAEDYKRLLAAARTR